MSGARETPPTEVGGFFYYSPKSRLKIIGVLKNLQLAEDKILAVPTLARTLPKPIKRIIGDMSDKEKVLLGLDLI